MEMKRFLDRPTTENKRGEKKREVRLRSTEVKTEYDSTWPEVQDADHSEGFGIQKELNVWIIITEYNCESDIK
jgi:hypothetical protein